MSRVPIDVSKTGRNEHTAVAPASTSAEPEKSAVVSLDERVFTIMSGDLGLEECGPAPRIVRWFDCWSDGE